MPVNPGSILAMECSITKQEVIEVIDEVFFKMGVKPLGEDAHLNADLYLNLRRNRIVLALQP